MRFLAYLLSLLAVVTGCSGLRSGDVQQPQWPGYAPGVEYAELVRTSVGSYKAMGYDPSPRIKVHTATGDYMNYSTSRVFREVENLIKFDEDGVPMRTYGDEYVYNPVLVAQYALHVYGLNVMGEDNLQELEAAMDRLLQLQDERGAFIYDFEWRYYLLDEPYEAGWVSAMAQGQALSALSRAYHLTRERRYLRAGQLAMDYLLTRVADGGVMDTMDDLDPSLGSYIIFEEYLSEPASYTLNGFMYTLLGLYDWAEVTRNDRAAYYYERGLDTLRRVLPYYDLGGFSAYDLSHITWDRPPNVPVRYHSVHLYLLHALNSITNDPVLEHFSETWKSYVN